MFFIIIEGTFFFIVDNFLFKRLLTKNCSGVTPTSKIEKNVSIDGELKSRSIGKYSLWINPFFRLILLALNFSECVNFSTSHQFPWHTSFLFSANLFNKSFVILNLQFSFTFLVYELLKNFNHFLYFSSLIVTQSFFSV